MYLVDCLPPFFLVLFLELCSVLSFGTCFFVFPFWLPTCVSFYVLNRAAMSSGLSRVALCSRCAIGPSGTVFPGHLSQVLQVCLLYGLCIPSYYSLQCWRNFFKKKKHVSKTGIRMAISTFLSTSTSNGKELSVPTKR